MTFVLFLYNNNNNNNNSHQNSALAMLERHLEADFLLLVLTKALLHYSEHC